MANVLEKYFDPRSVAVIGASATPHRPGNDLIVNLHANGYGGAIYPVNPRGGEILGHKVYASVAELPDGVDLAVVLLPAKAGADAIRACGARGIRAVVLAAGGFAEVDEEGRDMQDELARAVAESGVRVIGPNTAGTVSMPANFTSSFFPLGAIPRGRIAYIAQSGTFSGATMRYIQSGEHFGVSRVFGLGNKVDVEESELLAALGDDPETDAIFLYLETFADLRRFVEVAREVTRRKPVILQKGGSSDAGARAAVAHTGSLASDARLIEGALRQAGVVQVDEYNHLVLCAKALAGMPLPRGNRISIISPSGAFMVCLTDLAHRRLGLAVPDFEDKTRARLQEMSPDFIRMRNPVDIWPAVTAHGMEFAHREGMAAVLADANIDAVVAILMLTDEIGSMPMDFLVELKERHPDKPIYIAFSGDTKHDRVAKDFLEPRGIPTYPLMEQPLEVLSILWRARQAMARP